MNESKTDIFEYLDDLRESGIVNMFGSPEFIQDEFGLSQDMARDIVSEWMRTFSQRHS